MAEFLNLVFVIGQRAGLTEKDKDWDELDYWINGGGGKAGFQPPPSDTIQESSLACAAAAKVLQKIANLEGEARKLKSVRMSEIRKDEERELQEKQRQQMSEVERLIARKKAEAEEVRRIIEEANRTAKQWSRKR